MKTASRGHKQQQQSCHNPIAKALRTLRPKRVPSAKLYRRLRKAAQLNEWR